MTRRISCRECWLPWPKLEPKVAQPPGWKRREVFIVCTFSGQCDICNRKLNDGDIAVAETTWRTAETDEPNHWEENYGKPVSLQEIVLIDKLQKK